MLFSLFNVISLASISKLLLPCACDTMQCYYGLVFYCMHQCNLCWNEPSIGNLLSFDGLIQHSFHTSVFIYLMHPIVFSIQMLQYFRHFVARV